MDMLSAENVDIWYCHCDDADLAQWRRRYWDWLLPDEQERYRRYAFEKDQRQLLVSRALLRTVLSRYAPIAPSDWRFERTRHGKPFIAAPLESPPLRFNISNTEHLVACAVTLANEIGIDVEPIDRRVDDNLARSCLTTSELLHYARTPDDAKRRLFYRYWTLKESYVKARGLGLSLPLTEISFALHDGAPPTVAFDSPADDDPRNWQFFQMLLDDRHCLAVSVQRPAQDSTRFIAKRLALMP